MVRAMDLSSPTNTNTKKTQDTDSQTPPPLLLPQPQPHPQPLKSLSFTINGSVNRHQQPPPPPPQKMVVSYKECLKNHAAAIGGHALDGCGEFMPSPTAVPSDPTSLKCAACGCHRNFHRRNPEELYPPRHVSSNNLLHLHLLPSQPPQPLRRNSSPSPSLSPGRSSSPGPTPTPTPSPTPSPQSPPPVSHLPANYSSYFASPPQMLLALSSGSGSRPSDGQYQNLMTMNPTVPKSGSENVNARKRFRTKFSREQKEKMCLFAEKLGWKMQRSEEKMVEEFCKEVGVRKGVLKVWMHNNKHTLAKRSSSSGSGLISRVNNVINVDNHHHHHHHHQDINTREDTDDQRDDDES